MVVYVVCITFRQAHAMKSIYQISPKRVLTATLLIAVIAVAAASAFAASGFSVFVLKGHSMEPTITPGSLVIVREIAAERLAVGDVAVFQVGWVETDIVAAHRVTDLVSEEQGILAYTMGDGNKVADPEPVVLATTATQAIFSIANGMQILRATMIGGLALVVATLYLWATSAAPALTSLFASRGPVKASALA